MEIIAEIGQNHNGDMGLARELIRAAKENGADAAKFQVFEAKSLFPKKGNPWFEYNCAAELSRDQVEMLALECRRAGLEFLASSFDPRRVRWLEQAGVRRHKLASRSVNDKELIKAMTATGKPLLASLGMWPGPGFPHLEGLTARADFLYCVSEYPAPLEKLKLSQVDFTKYAGFSDHSLGLTAAQTALARGAKIIEKHFTLDKNAYGPDHAGSMTPPELKALSGFRDELRQCL